MFYMLTIQNPRTEPSEAFSQKFSQMLAISIVRNIQRLKKSTENDRRPVAKLTFRTDRTYFSKELYITIRAHQFKFAAKSFIKVSVTTSF